MDNAPLFEDLKHEDGRIRDRATQALWQQWFNQKGEYGLDYIRRSQLCIEQEDFVGAEQILNEVLADQPDFAEAWNRRAVLFYIQGQYRKALQDCRSTLNLNPQHFGAWHGLGLSHFALGEYSAAIQSFQRALAIQPHAIVNQQLLLECTARLS